MLNITETLDNMSLQELEEVVKYCVDIITKQAEEELEELKRAIADRQARLKSIQGRKNGGVRTYREIVNPNNPDEVYRTGPHPAWLTQRLKEELGDKYGDKVEMALLISLWKKVGMK